MIDKNISYDVKKVDNDEWNKILAQFDDSNIYQTAMFNRLSTGGKNLEQFTIKLENEVVSACLLRIKTVPLVNRGIAFLRWGPMFRKKKSEIDLNIFNITLNKLKEEYCTKRKLILEISSNIFHENTLISCENFLEENYRQYGKQSKTILVDLTKDEETLKMGFRKKWRYTLKQAEKKELSVEHNTSQEYYQIFLNIYSQMVDRKKFTEYVDPAKFMSINSQLPEEQKLEIFICKKNNEPISAIVLSTLGDTGIYLFGGTTSLGLDLNSSYLLQWEAIKWLKSRRIKWYDLGGIDEVENPGGYTFKTGMGGKELTFLGRFSAGNNFTSKSIINFQRFIKKRKLFDKSMRSILR